MGLTLSRPSLQVVVANEDACILCDECVKRAGEFEKPAHDMLRISSSDKDFHFTMEVRARSYCTRHTAGGQGGFVHVCVCARGPSSADGQGMGVC